MLVPYSISYTGGGPGIGKTQLGFVFVSSDGKWWTVVCSLQLCVNAAIPEEFNGLASHAVFIGTAKHLDLLTELVILDTEGSFSVERILDITQGTLNALYRSNRANLPSAQIAVGPAIGTFVKNVCSWWIWHLTRFCLAFTTFEWIATCSKSKDFLLHRTVSVCFLQLALFKSLPRFLQQHPDVRLVVVDSISIHFRQGFDDMSYRTRLLNQMAQDMMAIAETNNLAVSPAILNTAVLILPCLGGLYESSHDACAWEWRIRNCPSLGLQSALIRVSVLTVLFRGVMGSMCEYTSQIVLERWGSSGWYIQITESRTEIGFLQDNFRGRTLGLKLTQAPLHVYHFAFFVSCASCKKAEWWKKQLQEKPVFEHPFFQKDRLCKTACLYTRSFLWVWMWLNPYQSVLHWQRLQQTWDWNSAESSIADQTVI